MHSITKAKYKEFLTQSVELVKCKESIAKMQNALKIKSHSIKVLQSKIKYYKQKNINCISTYGQNDYNKNDAKVSNFIL